MDGVVVIIDFSKLRSTLDGNDAQPALPELACDPFSHAETIKKDPPTGTAKFRVAWPGGLRRAPPGRRIKALAEIAPGCGFCLSVRLTLRFAGWRFDPVSPPLERISR